ncbi:MAG: HlyD family efflux transporter periplasmic adaptor subunit [Phycisphaeraceae bacterium]|nr:HlyD family efflux transporter periplasmic adaptor subunit [Phycisphaeraceae bacterium]
MKPMPHFPRRVTCASRPGGLLVPTIVILVLIAAIVVALGLLSRSGGTEPAERLASEWFTVDKRSFDLIVMANGELEAAQQAELKCQIESGSTIIEILPEGTHVNKGDVVVKLAEDQVKEKVEQERLSTEQARSDKVAAETDLAIAINEADIELKDAKLKLELSRLDLEKWQRGDDPKKQRELELSQQKAARDLDRAREDLASSEDLFKEDFISQSELDDDRLKLIEAKANLETAKLDIEVYEKYTQPKERKQAESDVDQAAAELDRKVRSNDNRIAQAKSKLAARISQLRIREDRLAKLEEQLTQAIIKAPQGGLVVYASTVGPRYRRGDPIVAGRQVRFNESIVMLPDTSRMIVRLKVHEAMVSQVKLGQKVTVTIDARAGKPLDGKIIDIGVMAEDAGWLNPDLREYPVKVELPDLGEGVLKPAMRCTARIFTGRVEDAMSVPVQAVFAEGRQRYCHVPAEAGRVRRQPVTIGRARENDVEILTGLSVGDRVLLRRPRPGEAVSESPAAANATQPANDRMSKPE